MPDDFSKEIEGIFVKGVKRQDGIETPVGHESPMASEIQQVQDENEQLELVTLQEYLGNCYKRLMGVRLTPRKWKRLLVWLAVLSFGLLATVMYFPRVEEYVFRFLKHLNEVLDWLERLRR